MDNQIIESSNQNLNETFSEPSNSVTYFDPSGDDPPENSALSQGR